jgi:hypothetical protein
MIMAEAAARPTARPTNLVSMEIPPSIPLSPLMLERKDEE